MRPGEECPYITRCGWCCKFDAPCKDVVEDSKKREDKKDGQNSSDQKSVTDMQLESLAERQKQSVPIMSDEEINKMFGE